MAVVFAASSFASYPYYGGATLQSYNDDAPNWVINNSGNAAEAPVTGLTVASANGASYITPHLAPDGTPQYEAEMTTKIAGSGGTYVIYLEATSNALLGATSTSNGVSLIRFGRCNRTVPHAGTAIG